MADEVYEGAIGIDLGTTYSCVANYAGNQVEISVFNSTQHLSTPRLLMCSLQSRK